MTDAQKAIEQHPLLRELDVATQTLVVRESKIMTFRQKRTILKEGDKAENAYFLLDGAVRVFHRSTNKSEYLLKLFKAPALFGEMEAMVQGHFIEHVTTLTPCTLMQIPAAVFVSLIETQPIFAKKLSYDLAARLCIAAENIRSLAFGDVERRLACLLLDYNDLAGVSVNEGTMISLSVSQDQMAKDLSVSRKALNETLVNFKSRGWIEKRNARYVLKNIKAIQALVSRNVSITYALS